MQNELLIVSWLNGRMKFLSVRDGRCVATWEYGDQAADLDTEGFDLPAVLQEAVQATGYAGRDVALVFENAKLVQQLIETPPAKGRSLELYIERQLSQISVADEDVVWSWESTQPIKDSNGLVLYMFPKRLQERMIQDCSAAGLHLTILVSPTAVLGGQLSQLELEDDEIALLAVETEGTTAVVVARKQGSIFLARSLRCSWLAEPQRVAMEISRSLAFVKQQFGVEFTSIWLAGEGAAAGAESIRAGSDIAVHLCPGEHSRFYWAEQVVGLPAEVEANLIDKEQRRARRRRLFVRISASVLALLVVLSVGASALVETHLRRGAAAVEELQSKATWIQKRKAEIEKRIARLERKRELVDFLLEDKIPPIPGWFLAYVASIFPAELVLINLEINRIDELSGEPTPPPVGLWLVRLECAGKLDAETTVSDVRAAFEGLPDTLESGPFHLRVTDATQEVALASKEPWFETPRRARSKDLNRFFIEGIMSENTPR